MIQIHTDGSCLGNPGSGGWAAVIIDGNRREEIFGGEHHTTNNRMELTAAIRALEKISAGSRVELFTDSSYLKNAFTNGWLVKWKRNGWRTSTRSPVLNRDLWLQLDDLILTRNVKFNWVKGHAGNRFNERCDTLARTTAEKFRRDVKISEPTSESKATVRISEPKSKPKVAVKISEPKSKPEADVRNSRPIQLSLFDL